MNDNREKARAWIDAGCPSILICNKAQLEEARVILDEADRICRENPSANVSREALENLRSDIGYAEDRHWTFQWKIIAGAIISVLLLYWWSGSKQDDIAELQKVVASVDNWQPRDTVLTLEMFKDGKTDQFKWDNRLSNAAQYKGYQLQAAAREYYSVQINLDYYLERTQTAPDQEKRDAAAKKAEELKASQPQEEQAAKDKFDSLNSMKFEEIKAMAVAEVGGNLDRKADSVGTVKFWFWFLLICIPLYIFACRPYGYTLNRYSSEAKTLNAIHRFGMWASGALVGGAAALHYTTIITKWSDGTTTKSDDGMGPVIMATKILLLIGAVLVFCFISCFIMAYATISGLIRNYDWRAIFAKLSSGKNTGKPAQPQS